MGSFVLVHGSGQNAASWSRVADALRARGHVTTAPDLPKQAPEWRLEDYARRIAESIPDPGAVVVAHSLSGAFLPLVPGVRGCSLLVFLAAVIPEPGKSVRDQLAEDSSMFSPEWLQAGPRWFDPSQQESLGREFLLHDCDEPTLSWGLRTLDPLDPRSVVTQPAPFDRWPDVASVSIVASEDRTLSPEWGRRICRRVLRREPIEIRSGHCPHISRPDIVADILERLAAPKLD